MDQSTPVQPRPEEGQNDPLGERLDRIEVEVAALKAELAALLAELTELVEAGQ